jgi:hypothetical protein
MIASAFAASVGGPAEPHRLGERLHRRQTKDRRHLGGAVRRFDT